MYPLRAYRFLLILACVSRAADSSAPALPPRSPLASLLADAQAAESKCDVAHALALYRQADALHPDDPFILHEISKQISDSIDAAPDDHARLQLAREALAYSERAVQLAPRDPVCVLSLGVCYARIATLGDTRARIDAARKVQQYAEAALRLNPKYAWAHDVLGQWNLQMSHVNGPTRALARLFYGGLPAASREQAIEHLQAAVELDPQCPSHRLALGFVYLESGDKAEALAQFRQGLSLPTREVQDQKLKERALAALQELAPQTAAK